MTHCPCGCGRAPRPGRMFAGPHRQCLTRWRLATGRYVALAQRNRGVMQAGTLARAHRRAEKEARVPLTLDESRLWRKARQLGYENGRNVQLQHHARPPRLSRAVLAGSVGGQRAAKAKHRRVYERWCTALGLPSGPRLVQLWRRAYALGYWQGRQAVARGRTAPAKAA